MAGPRAGSQHGAGTGGEARAQVDVQVTEALSLLQSPVQNKANYSLTCIKRPLKGRMKNGLLIEVVS